MMPVSAVCDDFRMGWTDLVDVANEVLPRRWKRKLSAAILAGFVLFPSEVRDAVLWYGQERGKQIAERFVPLVMPSIRPVLNPAPSP